MRRDDQPDLVGERSTDEEDEGKNVLAENLRA